MLLSIQKSFTHSILAALTATSCIVLPSSWVNAASLYSVTEINHFSIDFSSNNSISSEQIPYTASFYTGFGITENSQVNYTIANPLASYSWTQDTGNTYLGDILIPDLQQGIVLSEYHQQEELKPLIDAGYTFADHNQKNQYIFNSNTFGDYPNYYRDGEIGIWDSTTQTKISLGDGRIFDINNTGNIVGRDANGSDYAQWDALFWEQGQQYNLNTLIDPNLGLHLYEARGINDQGQIVALGIDSSGSNSLSRVVLLDPITESEPNPIPEPSTILGLLGILSAGAIVKSK
ncbi:PEP-CTERM sorting domain-containing protein [Spirulina sp. CS-785/01]|uniref:PEP-CTERM sorting domain-containing protein n=1 Tax=Spirulina sp. CS-785/01 TaxID=3021716 RepID=UPI0023309C44|nr:PEP-CTERM sorting domain-containing protein [Spirulina sp. CS-785/01]MDB9314282.1 PEP-CTERM sorting domain-containing protein [Spirulina sp. CS-785/01]